MERTVAGPIKLTLTRPSEHEHDALADLFLSTPTITLPAPGGGVGDDPHGGWSAGVAAGAGHAMSAESNARRSSEGGPAVRLFPTSPLPALVRESVLEAVLVGHTPGLGAAWVTQYARHLSDRHNAPIALVRTQAGRLSIEVFGLPAGTAQAQPSTLGEAMRVAHELAERILVRVDEVDEPELLSHPGLSAVTLISGADDPAIVACYRSLKHVSGVLERRAQAPTAASERVELGLAIVGATGVRADTAEQKVRRAASTFLDCELAPAARIEKMHSGARPFVLFYGDASMGVGGLVDTLTRIVGGAAQTPAIGHAGQSTPASATPNISQTPTPAPARAPIGATVRPASPEAVELLRELPLPSLQLVDEQPAPGAASSRIGPAPSGARPSAQPSSTPPFVPLASATVSSMPAPAAPTSAQTSASLGSHAARLIEGLRVMDVACPYAGRVVFALDGAGSLHLVHEHMRGVDAIHELLAAAAWARDHSGLLTKLQPMLRCTGDGLMPTLHLLVEDAREARNLLESAVRVHLVVRTQVGGQPLVLAKPLN